MSESESDSDNKKDFLDRITEFHDDVALDWRV